jgi:polyhydroxyalkanoate synthesis regulator phasin
MMDTQTDYTDADKKRGPLYEVTRQILLAAIGAISLAQDEVNAFVTRLVDRGELAESDAKNLVKEMMERRERMEQERRQQHTESKQPAATRADIDALNARIADLTRQIEELRGQQVQP